MTTAMMRKRARAEWLVEGPEGGSEVSEGAEVHGTKPVTPGPTKTHEK